jgi:hypothetical protein
MGKRRFVIAALLLVVAPAASAQSTSEAPTRVTLSAMNASGDSCLDLIRLADRHPGAACVVSGTITSHGQVDDAAARCEVRSFEGPARRCFNLFTLKKEHAGETGPVCAALLFVPVGRDAKALRISLKEYAPCTSLQSPN